MRNKEYGIALNWNYVILSLVDITVMTLLVLYMPGVRDFDYNLLRAIRNFLFAYPSYVPVFISDFGMHYYLAWPQIAAVSVLVSHKYYTKAFLIVFFTQASFVLVDLIKGFVCRQRPLGTRDIGYSFPSGHATSEMCFYGIVIYLVATYVKNDFWRKFLIMLFGLWIFLVGISRMWVLAHFPIDVITGFFLGFLLVNLFIIVSRWLSR